MGKLGQRNGGQAKLAPIQFHRTKSNSPLKVEWLEGRQAAIMIYSSSRLNLVSLHQHTVFPGSMIELCWRPKLFILKPKTRDLYRSWRYRPWSTDSSRPVTPDNSWPAMFYFLPGASSFISPKQVSPLGLHLNVFLMTWSSGEIFIFTILGIRVQMLSHSKIYLWCNRVIFSLWFLAP